ncbi:DeoR/GlpR family DNA-binding transcription regulator [Roseitranquillus sediminis]|uniref:DeoR/GlpR family DNA-binding transcription regulator n=1 Tax=Roseitranquillus sediminis TaxID=2809051 RepID=UPI001D0CAD68|nr:DeoR/GlpR family DNA-binding transcription regulator [Roseitranquillus sediminis]
MGETTGMRRLRKTERRDQILLELRLKPHVRIAELATRFGVSSETVRRDVEELSRTGLISRAHGGASAAPPGLRPDLDARNRARLPERERIGRLAASLVQDGDTLMIDAGSTTLQLARFLAFAGTAVVAITNSLQVAMALGQSRGARVVLCPGDYLPAEAAVTGPEALDFIGRHSVDKCLLGAAGLDDGGVSEGVAGFAAIKRAMLRQAAAPHFLIDASKFGMRHLESVAAIGALGTVIADREPPPELAGALTEAGVQVLLAPGT